MSASNKRPVAGPRSPARSKTSADATRRMRMGLLGSTALVAASFIASGAMAQSYPIDSGFITVTGGGTTTDETGNLGGFQNVGGTSFLIADVTIANSTGSPSAHAINITRSAFSGGGDGIQLLGNNNFTAATGGTGLNFVSTGGNNTGIGFGGTLTATGLNGIAISTLGELYQSGSATIDLTAQTNGSGTGLSMSAGNSIGDTGLTGAVTITNFATGISLTATNGHVDFRTGSGGAITGATTGVTAQGNTSVFLNIGSSISASSTGIRANASNGLIAVTASGAITAGTGINATSTNGVTVTTTGGGTINSTSNDVGTGIIATSSGGTNAVTVNVGAAIGTTTRFATGVEASTTGTSTGTVNVSNTAAVSGRDYGIHATSLATTGNTVNVSGDVSGLFAVNTVGAGFTVTVNNGATVTGVGANNRAFLAQGGDATLINHGILTSNGLFAVQFGAAGTVTNNGTITGTSTGIGLSANTGLTLTNQNGGTITGVGGIYVGGSSVVSITNQSGGTITGSGYGIALFNNTGGSNTLDLQAGSTTGRINSIAAGLTTVTLAGAMTDTFSGSGAAGAVNFTLASTGSMTSANFGSANDTFNWQGGAIGSTINAGTGTADDFNSVLGAGSGSLSLSNLSNFDTYDHVSGTLTLTGSRDGGAVWTAAAATTLNLSGSLTNTSGGGLAITAAAGATVNVLGTGVLDNWVSLYFNGPGTSTVTNSGSINGQSTAIFSTSGRVNFTNNAGGTVSTSGASAGTAIALASGGGTIINNGSVMAATGAGISSSNIGIGVGSSLTNGAGNTVTGGSAGVVMTGGGAFNITNAGTINGSNVGTGSGVNQTAGIVTIANNSGGSITGNGYAVNTTGGALVLTNASGAMILGGSVAAIRADTGGTATIDLQAGSTLAGDVILAGTGARTMTVAGAFTGNLDATGNSGAVNLTLNTSATGYTLLQGGSGADTLTFSGSGSRTFSVDNLTSWDTGAFTGGAWTLTGTGNGTSFVSGLTINGAALNISNTQQLQGATGLTMTGGGSITTTASLSNTRTINLTGAGSLGAASGQTLTQSGVVSGAGVLSLTGLGSVVLSGNNTYTGGTTVNSGILQLGHTSGAGTGVIHMIDPQINFAVTGTYNNNISLEVVNGQQAVDPTILNNTSGGAITLAGRIYETGGVGGAGQYVTFSGGSITLTNSSNSWAGVTTINSGATLLGTTASISGASIVNNGTLTYANMSAGTANQAISGSGAININGLGTTTLAGAITTSGQLTVSGAGANLILGGARSGSNNTGAVVSGAGASLTVANGGSIQSGHYNGVRLSGDNTTLTNLGIVQNTGTGGDSAMGAGVRVVDTAGTTTTINNGSVTDAGAGSTIQGLNAGVRHDNSAQGTLVVNNYGRIVGDIWNGIENTNGGLTVHNFAGGEIYAASSNGIYSASSSAVSVTNAGVIGRDIANTQTVGQFGLVVGGALTLSNQSGGTVIGTQGGVFAGNGGTITNLAGGLIRGDGATARAIDSVGAGLSVINAGTISGYAGIVSNNAGLVGATGYNFILDNQATGQILSTGEGAVYTNGRGNVTNAGLIESSYYGVSVVGGLITNNSGGVIRQIDAAGLFTVRSLGAVTLINGGTISNAATLGYDAVFLNGGQATVTNTGTVTATSGSGVTFGGANSSIVNSGTITGGTSGYGISEITASGTSTITNQSGGVISGGLGSIHLAGANNTTINLMAGSTTTGRILSDALGTHTVNIAGTLNGAYDASTGGGAIDNLTLASTGSMTSAALGFGVDSFTYQGGAFSGLVDAGDQTDAFISALGAGSASVNLSNLANFEIFSHQSGTLTLSGTAAFSSDASLQGGTLIVNGTLQSMMDVANGAVLSGGGSITGAVTVDNGGVLANTQGSTLTMGSLGLSSGSTINATFSGAGGAALFAVTGDLTLDGTVNVASSGAYGFGVYGLMTYGGALTNNGLVIGTTPGGAQRVGVQTSVAGQVNIVHAPTELLFWDGDAAGQHDNGAVNGGSGTWTAAGSEWTDADGLSNGSMEPQPGFAIFQGAGGVVTVDDVAGAVGVTGMQFAADGYRIAGDSITLADASTTVRVGDGTAPSAAWAAAIASTLTGTGGLVKTDLGTLILVGDNDYTGGTTVNAGTLQIGEGGATGSILGSVALANNSTLIFSRTDGYDFTNDVSGAGSVGVNGFVTLSGAITATGGVDLYGGSEATVSNVNVASGSAVYLAANTLVTVAAGGSVISQNGAGVESVGSSIYNYGSIQGTTQGVLTAGGSVWNYGGASAISGVTGIRNTSSAFALAVYNEGTITGSTTAVSSVGNLMLNNLASGTISGQFAISTLGNLNMANAGLISASVTNFKSSGIYAGGAGTISNTGTITSGTNAIYTQGAGALTNSGLIQGGGAASTVRLFGANSSVTNLASGEITTTGTGAGLFLDGVGATVVNSGTIRGGNAVNFVSGGGVLTNDGVLIGTTASGVVGNGGTLIANLTGGSITGATNGVNIVTGAGNLTNDGSITGTSGQGVLLQAGGTITNTGDITGGQSGVRSLAALTLSTTGTISGSVNAIETVGVFNDSLTFLAGSTTTGAVLTSGGDDVISLAGALDGLLNAGDGADTVSLFDTAGFTSTLDGGDGVDAFVLDGVGTGSIDIGSVFNFESRAKNGAGVWILTGVDASTVAWALNAGVLELSGGSAINDAAGVTIAAGGALALLDDETIGALAGSGFVDLGSSVLTLGAAQASVYGGVISGSGDLAIGAAHVLTLTGANTYTGTTFVDGVLTLGAAGVLADGSSLLIGSTGVVDLQTFDETVDSAFIEGVLNGSGTLTAFAYGLDGATVNANLGAGALYNLGGVSTLNGLIGADLVSVDAGTLVLGASNRLADTAILAVASGATFDLGAFSDTIDVAILEGTLAGTGTLTSALYGLAGATVNANLGTGVLFNIDGTSTLNGTSAAELVAVLEGTLSLGASDRIVDTADLQVLSGATFDLGAFDETVNVTELNGMLAGTGTLTAVQHQLDGATINANLAGGSVYVIGGASTLNGVSSADLLSVLSGSLTLGASNRIADTATLGVSSDATLDMGAFNETVAFAGLAGTVNGTGTLTAAEYDLNGATINGNLGAGNLFNTGGVSTLNGLSGAGLVSVQAGTLALGASNRLADTAAVLVASGSTLNLGAFNDTVGLAALYGALNGTGTLTAGEYNLNGATVNANLGAGNLFNTGGVTTLTGTSGAANVVVQAGTLALGASNRLVDTATVSVASGSTLNLGAFNDTVGLALLNGTLAGAGALTAAEYDLNGATVNANLGAGNLFNVGGVSTLTGTSGAANVVVQAGTLTLGASNRLADTATVSVASGSTLNLGAFNDTVGLAVINGALNGTGTLTAAQYQLNAAAVNGNLGAGTLFNLGGVSTLNGTAAASQVSINAGTLRLGANERLSDTASVSVASGTTFNVNGFNERIGALFGTGDVNVGAGRLTFGGIESGFGGRLSGTGSVVHTGGLFTLMGSHTIASISNTGGELRFLGATTGGLSASGGSVTGAGTIGGALTASNGAILSPGLAGIQSGIGGFTAGGLTLNGGTLAIDVLGASGGNLIDQLRINGTATLTGGLLTPTFQGSAATDFNFSTRYLFLQANNLVGTFANGGTFTAAAQPGLFWRVRYDLSPNAAVLELRELTNFDPGATGTDNQRGVGQALSGGQLAASDDWAAILSLIAGLNAADRAAAFDSISGEPLADVTTSMFSANDTFLTAVRDGGLNGLDDGGEALNFVDRMSFAGGRENSADRLGDVLGAFDPSASTGRGAGGWVSAYSGDQTLDGKPGQATVESTLNGFAGGYGVRNGSLSVGAAGGVTRLEGDVVARDGHYESDLSHAAGYVAFDDGVWAADVSASFYGGDLDTRRGITVGAFRGQAIGNTHVEGQSLSASVARRFQVSDNTMIALGAIGTASNASVDGYTEVGAGGLSLTASGQERDWQSLQLSARATQDYRVNGQGFRIYGGAGVMAMTGDRQATGDMRFTGAPVGFGTFTVEGAEAPPVAGLADFGIEVGAGEGVTVSAGYRGLFSERLQDNQVGVKLQVSW